ncbi:DUF485 domain-containing protein [Streptomyces sp. NPDC004647]|uniref:DUF485 domain-containing protein n=1 Tax=Streptomyces sp. NPDC004647 TaxID=3154671 RepID=UPI0033BA7B6D
MNDSGVSRRRAPSHAGRTLYGGSAAGSHDERPARRTLYEEIGATEDFQWLRTARRSRTFAVTGAVLALYVFHAVLANEARGVMAARVVGHLNVGLSLWLLQCVTTVVVVSWYARYARNTLDPSAARMRAGYERAGGER